MEPLEVLGFAGVAVTGWALGRASRRREVDGTAPGDAIAASGARLSRDVAFGTAALGSRVLTYSAACAAFAGSAVARGVGIGTDMALGAGDAIAGATRRVLPSPSHHREIVLPSEESESGLVLPVDVNATV